VRVLGIDPDLHTTGWAEVSHWPGETYKLQRVGIFRAPPATRGNDAVLAMIRSSRAVLISSEVLFDKVVVEGQQIYRGRTKNPPDILRLAQVAGGIVAAATHLAPNDGLLLPTPMEWKKQVPKSICQRRAYRDLGLLDNITKHGSKTKPNEAYWALNDPSIPGTQHLKVSDWKHVSDAVALALWGVKLLALKPTRR
jgi:hypothetical protein